MIRQLKWLALATVVLSALPVLAQGPGGGGRGPGGGRGMGGFGGPQSKYALLSNEAVQAELALSADQKTQAKQLLDSYQTALRGDAEAFQGLRDLTQEERSQKMAELAKERQEKTAKVNAEYAPKFAAVLEDIQLTRLQELYWQSLGGSALRDADLAAALKLSDEQKEKIAEASRSGRGPRAEGGDRPSREDMAAQRAKQEAAVLDVLTAEQKTQLATLKGAAFDVSKLRGEGGPGGRRGGEGGGRPNRAPST